MSNSGDLFADLKKIPFLSVVLKRKPNKFYLLRIARKRIENPFPLCYNEKNKKRSVMNDMKFYICKTCGKIVKIVKDSTVPVMCCGKKMEELIPGSVDASAEKHVPIFTVDDNKVFVMVGDVVHPMSPEHFIEWIAIETESGMQIKYLSADGQPAASFCMGSQDRLIAVYAYCNLHGLWKKEYEEAPVCNLKPINTETNENYVVCQCNNVSYFDILNAAQEHGDLNGLLSIFDEVKNTTHCSTGCGGCYNKVLAIISEMMSGKLQ